MRTETASSVAQRSWREGAAARFNGGWEEEEEERSHRIVSFFLAAEWGVSSRATGDYLFFAFK